MPSELLLVLIVLRKIKVPPAAAKRFWKTTSIKGDDRGFLITLDGREVKTPEGFPFIAKSEKLAEKIKSEWDAQIESINPDTMPMYKFAVTAIDRVSTQRQAVVQELLSYGNSDLLCYREDRDYRLAEHQQNIWHPYIDWASKKFNITLKVFEGIMPGEQDDETIAAFENAIERFEDHALSGLHSLVTVSGSLILGLAAALKQSPLEDIIDAAFLDDLWQQDKWGYDEDAAVRLKNHRQQIEDAHQYLELLA